LVGSVPREICDLQLANLEVDCDTVQCDCCTECAGSDIPIIIIADDDPLYLMIVAAYPEGGEALFDTSSPQFAAFQWLKSTANTQITADQRLLQRYVLATLFYSTRGSDWEVSSRWLSDANECSWFSSAEADVCDANGNYIDISLHENNLRGTLPMEVLLLSDTLGKLPSSFIG
jgi:hypothetical protein